MEANGKKTKGRGDLENARPLIAGKDYTVDALGRWVFTAEFLRERGYCCESGCQNCPYGFRK